MTDPIRSFFDRRMDLAGAENGEANPPHDDEEATRARVHLAACALLLELAYADDEFSEVERMHIEAVLRRHLNLDVETAQQLMALAEAARLTGDGIQSFATLVASKYDRGQKTLLAEVMWGLILADGEIARREAYLLQRIAKLLDLEPGYLAEVRKSADGL